MSSKNVFIISFFILVSVVIFSAAILKMKDNQGFVTVKGSSEKFVLADRVTWNIAFSVVGNDLEEINRKVLTDTDKVKLFLKKFNVKDAEISLGQLSLIDNDAREYGDKNQKNRFIITQNIFVESNDVDAIEDASRSLTEIIKEGVSLKNDYGTMRPVYEYTKIDDIKNQMIEEATKKAKSSAEQFAKDSNAEVGKIKRANQGTIIINAKNKASGYDNDERFQKEKQVRVVTTVDYWLK